MKQLAKWIALGCLLLWVGAAAAQQKPKPHHGHLSGYVVIAPKQEKKEFTDKVDFASIFKDLGLDNKLLTVIELNINKGHIITDDWRYLRDHKIGGVDNLNNLVTLTVEKTVDQVDDMPLDPVNPDLRADRILWRGVTVRIHKLKKLSNRAFYDNILRTLELPDVESMEQEVFAFTHLLTRMEFPKLKSIGKDAFHDSRFLRAISTPVLESLSNKASADFKRCYDLSLWKLGGTVPKNATDLHFGGCAENRNIVFVNADGSPMTGQSLNDAIAKFKSDAGYKDGKWYGWFIEGARHAIQFDSEVSKVLKGYYTVPTDISLAGRPVQVRSYVEDGWRIDRLWYEYTEGGVLKTQEIDLETMQFIMPNAPVTIKATRKATEMTVRVNGDDNLKIKDKGLKACFMAYDKKVGGHHKDVLKLEILEGYMVSADWLYLGTIYPLRELDIAATMTLVEQPREYFWMPKFLPDQIRSAMIRKVQYVPSYFADDRRMMNSIRFPNVKEMGETSINHIGIYENFSLELGLPGAAVPKVGLEPFWDNQLPKSRYLVMLDQDGKELTGGALTQAKERYKNYNDGDTGDGKWFGWNLDYLHITVELKAGQEKMGELRLINPARGITGEGDEVQLLPVPKRGYRVKPNTLEYRQKGGSKPGTNYQWIKIQSHHPKHKENFTFEMPDTDVAVRVEFEPISLEVICESPIPHVTLTSVPSKQVIEGSEVVVTATLEDEGYELEANSFYYKEEGNRKAHPVQLTDIQVNGKVVTGKFIMPNYSVRVYASALGKEHTVSACSGIAGGHLETVPADKARYGSKVSVVLVPNDGYVAKLSSLRWKTLPSGAEQTMTNNSFTMPNADVQVCCEFEAVTGGSRAVFTPKLKGGRIEANPNNNVDVNAEVSLTITPDCGYVFTDFASLKYTTPDGVEHQIPTTNKFNMPNSSVTVKCNFTPTQQRIEFLPMAGGSVKVASPAGTQYSTDQEVVLEVKPDRGWKLEEGSLRYIKKGETAGWVAIQGNRFPMPCYDIQIEARFVGNGHTVRIDPAMSNGTLLANPNTNVQENTEVRVTAQPDEGFFMLDGSMEYRILPAGTAWTKLQRTQEGDYTFNMPNASVELRANFISDGGNRVIILPTEHGKITANRTVAVPENFTVVLTYVAETGWDLESGSLQYRVLPDGEWRVVTGLQFVMPNASVEVRGNFYPTGNSVFQHREVLNGRLLATPWANVPVNTKVTIHALPDAGFAFDPTSLAWSEKGKDLWHNIPNAMELEMPNFSIELRGTFTPIKYWARSIDGIQHGQLIIEPDGGKAGTPIKVTMTTDNGYRLVPGSLAYKLESNTQDEWIPIEDMTFKMPTDNVWVRAQFERYAGAMYGVHIVVESGQGRLEVRNGTEVITDGMLVPDGAELSIARLPDAGWMVDKVLVNDTVFDGTVYKVHSDVTIKGLFVESENTAVDDAHVATVYPNPFGSSIRVQAEGAQELVLFTMEGQVLMHRPYGDGTVQDLERLPAGVYVLQVRFRDGATTTQRLVKR